jgi:hypothetical protein
MSSNNKELSNFLSGASGKAGAIREPEYEKKLADAIGQVATKYAMARTMEESLRYDKPTIDQLDQIRQETGWFKPEWYRKSATSDPGDTKWRFEISDKDLRFKSTETGKRRFLLTSGRATK